MISTSLPLRGSIPAFYSSIGCADNSCLSFEGMTVSGDSISYVILDDGASGGSNNLMFGNIEYAPAGTMLQAPSPVPEPSSLVLLGSGLLSLAAPGWRRRRNSSAR